MTRSSRQRRGRGQARVRNTPQSLTLLVLIALLLAGCGGAIADHPGVPHSAIAAPTDTPGSRTVVSLADGAVPPIILSNPAPTTLDVSMYVTFEQGVQDSQLMAEVGLGFTSGDQPIQLAGQERITCDGMDLPAHNRAADFQVIRAPASELVGTTMRCDYIADHTIASVYLLIPHPPPRLPRRSRARVSRVARTPSSPIATIPPRLRCLASWPSRQAPPRPRRSPA